MATVLTLTAQELHDLQSRLEGVEHNLEAIYHRAGHTLIAEEISALQEIDLVVQSAGAMADYLLKIADQAATSQTICVRDAINAVPLRDLAARLGGEEESQKKTGCAELF